MHLASIEKTGSKDRANSPASVTCADWEGAETCLLSVGYSAGAWRELLLAGYPLEDWDSCRSPCWFCEVLLVHGLILL